MLGFSEKYKVRKFGLEFNEDNGNVMEIVGDDSLIEGITAETISPTTSL
jgi:hypothetical protein